MKVLRIYDHLGELKKEFPVYVEGEDFKWQSSYPEPVWLGTITLEEPGKEPEAEPTPEVVVVEPLPEAIEEEKTEGEVIEDLKDKKYPMQIREEEKVEPKKVHGKRSRVKRTSPPASPEGIEKLPQEDSPEDFNPGD